MPDWTYDKGGNANRRKHQWDQATAGFKRVGNEQVGKCPAGFPLELAERLVNEAIRYTPPTLPPEGLPTRLYIVHEGVVYRAKPTNPGRSWHAFPESAAELQKLPDSTWGEIRARAVALGCEAEVEAWRRG